MPVYNCGRYLSQALTSIVRQGYGDFECIVVNDGSTDRTSAILAKYSRMDSRIRVIERENRGLVASLNEAIDAARGRYLGRMDGDDWCEPGRFARQISLLEDCRDLVAVGCSVRMVDSDGYRLKTYFPPQNHSAIVSELLSGNGGALIHPAVTLRTDAVRKMGGYDSRMSGYGEDWDIFLRLSSMGELYNLPEVLLSYRQHLDSYNITRKETQVELLNTMVNAARIRHGLSPMTMPAVVKDLEPPLRRWALWALEGGELLTALKHSSRDVVRQPMDRRSWSIFAYIIRQIPSIYRIPERAMRSKASF